MRAGMTTVAAVVISWNTRDLLAECLTSIATTSDGIDVETVVVDNGSSDGSADMVRTKFPTVRLIAHSDNRGFARANNEAIAATDAPYILMLNSDATLEPGTLRRLLDRVESAPRAGLVGAQLRDPGGAFQFSHARFPSLGSEALVLSGLGRALYGPWYPSSGPDADPSAGVVDWVGGACMFARRTAFASVGGFDEGYFLYGEEMDLCYVLRRAGWQVWYEPGAIVLHHGMASSRRMHVPYEDRLYRGRMRFFRKHHGVGAARGLAAELYLFTSAKILVHGALRALSGGRVGREVISLRALRAAVAAAPEPIARSMGGAVEDRQTLSAPSDTLVVATAATRRARLIDAAHDRAPRVDYVELCERLGAPALDYDVYPDGRAGAGLRRFESRIGGDPYLAWHALRQSKRHARLLCMSERVGIPLAGLRRAGMLGSQLGVLFQAWSPRQEAVLTRLDLFGAIDVVGVNTTAMRDHFVGLGVRPEKVHVLRWAVDHAFFTPSSRNGVGSYALTLGEHGRDYPLLLSAIDGLPVELRALLGGYRWGRHGFGPDVTRVPENVTTLPPLSYCDLRALYANSRFVVLPVTDVIYPAGLTALLEAMCMARAVIATRSRGLSDYVVEGETCLLVDAGDRDGLRDAIRRLSGDPQLARRLGENGRAHVEAGINQRRYVAQLADLVSGWTDRCAMRAP
jgi:GT2 family glycosyltransferase